MRVPRDLRVRHSSEAATIRAAKAGRVDTYCPMGITSARRRCRFPPATANVKRKQRELERPACARARSLPCRTSTLGDFLPGPARPNRPKAQLAPDSKGSVFLQAAAGAFDEREEDPDDAPGSAASAEVAVEHPPAEALLLMQRQRALLERMAALHAECAAIADRLAVAAPSERAYLRASQHAIELLLGELEPEQAALEEEINALVRKWS